MCESFSSDRISGFCSTIGFGHNNLYFSNMSSYSARTTLVRTVRTVQTNCTLTLQRRNTWAHPSISKFYWSGAHAFHSNFSLHMLPIQSAADAEERLVLPNPRICAVNEPNALYQLYGTNSLLCYDVSFGMYYVTKFTFDGFFILKPVYVSYSKHV